MSDEAPPAGEGEGEDDGLTLQSEGLTTTQPFEADVAKAIREMPHPGLGGSAEAAARRLLNHEMNEVDAFEVRANEASKRFDLLHGRLLDTQHAPSADFTDSHQKHTVMHQMLDLRRSLGKKKVDSALLEKGAHAALHMNDTLARDHERLRRQIAGMQQHVRKKTNRGNWDDEVDGYGVNRVTRVAKEDIAAKLAAGETEGENDEPEA